MEDLGRKAAASNFRYLVNHAVTQGQSREDVLRRFDLDRHELDDVDGRLPLSALARLWTELPAMLGDPDMPLNVMQSALQADPSLATLVFQSAPTLGDALAALVRYERLNFDLADEPLSAVVVDGEVAHVVLDADRAAIVPPPGAVVDSFHGVLTLGRATTGHPVEAVSIDVRHPLPDNPARWEAALRGPIRFGMPHDRLTLRTADLRRPHPMASPTLSAIVTAHADRKLAALGSGDDLLTRLREEIRYGLPTAAVGVAQLATAVGLGPRTLQRRLAEHGSSVRTLVDEERRALALRYVAQPSTSLIDIALLLGFSEQSAFSRAFQRWTGHSPRTYRRRHRS
ncbi:MAG: AraC family transcriptional regulator [Nannocystales bacterium]